MPLFFEEYSLDEEPLETVNLLQVRATCKRPQKGVDVSLPSLFENLQYVDHWQISVEDGVETFTFDNTQARRIPDFLGHWQKLSHSLDDTDECRITITVNKQVHDSNIVFIYNHAAFFSYLTNLKVIECIDVFSRHLRKCNGRALFVAKDLPQPIATATIHFLTEIPTGSNTPTPESLHDKSWERLKSVCHFSGIDECFVLPSDFKLISPEGLQSPLVDKLEKCCLVLVLCILFDFMTVKDDSLTGKLNGYKTFNANYDINHLSTSSLDTYYKIYTWLLTGGNLQDKMGIVRNLISLNVDAHDNYTLPDSVYPSILSGFKVYERQNIKQYIELRNKMSDQLIAFNEKAGKIVETFAGSFQKSALAVVSLYATMIIARVLSSQALISAFTLEATMLSLVFLLISLVYFFVSRWEVRQQRLRYSESYQNMKKRNEDLLTKEDIEKILNNDQEYQADLQYIDGKLQRYTFLWIFLLSVLAAVSLLMFFLRQTDFNSSDFLDK